MSRATLARRFSSLLGRPPLAYLTAWRMELARDALESTSATIASVARTVGYADEFATAFKREVGIAPGRYRTHREIR